MNHSERLPAKLLHEQRDYCGAHTCKRLDKKRGEFFRTELLDDGGKVASTTYEL